jgi:hypothetical protein
MIERDCIRSGRSLAIADRGMAATLDPQASLGGEDRA